MIKLPAYYSIGDWVEVRAFVKFDFLYFPLAPVNQATGNIYYRDNNYGHKKTMKRVEFDAPYAQGQIVGATFKHEGTIESDNSEDGGSRYFSSSAQHFVWLVRPRNA